MYMYICIMKNILDLSLFFLQLVAWFPSISYSKFNYNYNHLSLFLEFPMAYIALFIHMSVGIVLII